jgi:Restriction endonuclease
MGSCVVRNDGKTLQRLIRSIESALAVGNTNIRVEMGKIFPDKVTGKPREHDVVLTMTHKHHETIIALECRDRSRPVGVDAVEAFHTKCEDTGIHSGIIVSGKGFYKTALEKAARYNIGCLRLDQAESFNWCLAAGMETYNRNIDHVELNFNFPAGTDVKQETIQLENGTLVTSEMVRTWSVNALNTHIPIPMTEGVNRVTFIQPNPKVFGIHNGARVQAIEVRFDLKYTVSVELSPFSFRTYLDEGKAKQITQVAVSEVKIGKDEVAEMVLSTNERGEINITLVRSPPTNER